MFLARLEGAPLSKGAQIVRRRRVATDNAVQKLYLEAYMTRITLWSGRVKLFFSCIVALNGVLIR